MTDPTAPEDVDPLDVLALVAEVKRLTATEEALRHVAAVAAEHLDPPKPLIYRSPDGRELLARTIDGKVRLDTKTGPFGTWTPVDLVDGWTVEVAP